uniref:Uncharacterized protein n=1 Tax=Pipistrellus kuhlii TaxID=59472 RepID=A0A7J7VBP4_PIPKU|nr:hypothetical protein mPipKuh1_008530 [Pipistrellus kuhlii]
MAGRYESYKFPRVPVTVSANFYEKPITEPGSGGSAIAGAPATGFPCRQAAGWRRRHKATLRATGPSRNAPSARERFSPDPASLLNLELITPSPCCYSIPTGPIAGKPRKTSTRNTLPGAPGLARQGSGQTSLVRGPAAAQAHRLHPEPLSSRIQL